MVTVCCLADWMNGIDYRFKSFLALAGHRFIKGSQWSFAVPLAPGLFLPGSGHWMELDAWHLQALRSSFCPAHHDASNNKPYAARDGCPDLDWVGRTRHNNLTEAAYEKWKLQTSPEIYPLE
ncbi:hypothetical protein BTVI_122546 [Pitangus sulphuratus]|nr:hypothetical protein BTVI_122546 [Pitangus sulphuratus]